MLRRKRAADGAAAAGPAAASSGRADKRAARANGQARTLEEAVFGASADAEILGADNDAADEEERVGAEVESEEAEGAAWVDDDDDAVTVDISARTQARKLRRTAEEGELSGVAYSERLREHFEQTHGSRPQWADAGGPRKRGDGEGLGGSDGEWTDEDGSEDGDAGRRVPEVRANRMLSSSHGGQLAKGVIDTTRVRDGNVVAPNKAAVQVVQFHPEASAMFTGGYDSTLRIFQIDGKVNPMVQSVHIPDLPIGSGVFLNEGKEIVLSGRRRFFYSYELETGTIRKIHQLQGRSEKSLEYMFASRDGSQLAFTGLNGEVILVSPTTKQVIGTVKMNGSARAVAFGSDGKLHTAGSDGKVYVWDARNRKRCVHMFTDDGAISCSALAVSSDDRLVACGSDSGVVNIYDDGCYKSSTPSPLKAIMNLTTNIHKLEFHPDSQILAIGSRVKKQAFRLFHIPSLTTFQNWPTAGSPLNYINAFAFSANGGYIALGNDKGKALMYRLNHYSRV